MHLMRGWYRTDADSGSVGTFSATIPDRFMQEARIVAVDWSRKGEVEVTFLVPGPGHDRH